MNTQGKEEKKKEILYCVLEKKQNPFGCRLSATPNLEYLWLYYYKGIKEKYNVYRVTKYRELPSSFKRNGFVFIEAKEVEVYNEVFEEYMKSHKEDRTITLEEMTVPNTIQKNILLGRIGEGTT